MGHVNGLYISDVWSLVTSYDWTVKSMICQTSVRASQQHQYPKTGFWVEMCPMMACAFENQSFPPCKDASAPKLMKVFANPVFCHDWRRSIMCKISMRNRDRLKTLSDGISLFPNFEALRIWSMMPWASCAKCNCHPSKHVKFQSCKHMDSSFGVE